MRAPRARFLQTLAVVAVSAAGVVAYQRALRPDRRLLARFAAEELRSIFGDGVAYEDVRIDLVDGVEIQGLAVRTPATDRPTLEARRVRVRHDVLALASGAYRPAEIEIEGARIVTHETETGIAPDFPFELGAEASGQDVPRLEVRDSTLLYRSRAGSTRLREGVVLVLEDVDLSVAPTRARTLDVRGGFFTRGLAQDQVRIQVVGTADARADRLALEVVWDPFDLSEHLLERVLAEEIAARLRGHPLEPGRLVVNLRRTPEVKAGELQVSVAWEGGIRMDLAEMPGAERIDARTREQLQALFSTGTLRFEVSEGRIDIRGLAAAAGGGEVSASGQVSDDGEEMFLLVTVEGLRLEDPSIREALGADGAAIFDEFDVRGKVNALVRISKRRGEPADFEVSADVEGVSFRYLGAPDETGRRQGFPYPVVDASGAVRITPGRVEVLGLTGVGARSPSFFTLLDSRKKGWTGGETGRILLTDAGADIRLTIVGENVPVDADLLAAVRGSEFADILETYVLGGRIDRLEIDVLRDPAEDPVAVTELRVTLGGAQFRYAKFPLDFEDVHGTVSMRRPRLAPGRRGRVFEFEVAGRADGAPAEASATFVEHENRGRLRAEAEGISLGGRIADAILATPGLAEGLGAAWRFLSPRGRADLQADLAIEEDPDPSEIAIRLRDASVRMDAARSPEPIEVAHLAGWILVRGDRVLIGPPVLGDPPGVQGTLEGVPVALEGRMDGGTGGRWALRVRTEVLRLTRALRREVARLAGAADLLPPGWEVGDDARMALEIDLRREPGPDGAVAADVSAREVAARLTLPSGLAVQVEGEAIRVEGDAVAVTNATASLAGAEVRVREGRIAPGEVTGRFGLVLDRFEAGEEVLGLLPEETRAEVADLLANRLLSTSGLEVVAPAEGGLQVDGTLRLEKKDTREGGDGPLGTVEAEGLRLSPEGPGGRTLVGVVRVKDLVYDPGVALDGVSGTVRITRLSLRDDPEGEASLEGVSGQVWALRAEGLAAPITWRRGILTVGPLTGTVAGGRLSGRVLVHTREPLAYEGSLRLEGFEIASLREQVAPSGPPLSGTGRAEIGFQNLGGRAADLTARGRVTVRDGNLGDLPAVANIFALLGGVLPVDAPPRFERADVAFVLADETIRFERLLLAGPLFEMPGRGTIDLAGTVDVTFTPEFIKSMLLPGVMQLPVVGDILAGALREELLYAVHVHGDLDDASVDLVPFPPLGLSRREAFPGTGVPEPLPRRVPQWFR